MPSPHKNALVNQEGHPCERKGIWATSIKV